MWAKFGARDISKGLRKTILDCHAFELKNNQKTFDGFFRHVYDISKFNSGEIVKVKALSVDWQKQKLSNFATIIMPILIDWNRLTRIGCHKKSDLLGIDLRNNMITCLVDTEACTCWRASCQFTIDDPLLTLTLLVV